MSPELQAALLRLYDVVWNETGTVEIDLPGYNGISHGDSIKIDEAGEAVEKLLALEGE